LESRLKALLPGDRKPRSGRSGFSRDEPEAAMTFGPGQASHRQSRLKALLPGDRKPRSRRSGFSRDVPQAAMIGDTLGAVIVVMLAAISGFTREFS
jgi:hypothetical protein